MPNCRTGTDLEKSPHFYISRRNTRQSDPITTHPFSMCCYKISVSCISSANIKKEVFLKSVPMRQLGIYPISAVLLLFTLYILHILNILML